jgi:hypothetical protein
MPKRNRPTPRLSDIRKLALLRRSGRGCAISPGKSPPRQLAVQLAFRGWSARRAHHTDGFHASARRAATVASGLNPPEQRPSVSTAAAHRRSGQPRSTARMARSRNRWLVCDVRRVREPLHLPVGGSVAGPDADRLRALPAGDAGGQFRRQPRVVRRRDRPRADGRNAEGVAGTTPTYSGVFARRAAIVASGVNPPGARPSVSGATSDRRSAQPRSTALRAA